MRNAGFRLRYHLSRLFSREPLRNPIFIIGCGRSGTTVLGRALREHPDVALLHEPRRLWASAYPFTDVWTHRAARRRGRLRLTADDAEPARSRRIHASFRAYRDALGRTHLVEKLPINSFRVEFVLEIFPDARIIHLVREGREVARSIARIVEQGGWYGYDGYKRDALVDLARGTQPYAAIVDQCRDAYDLGLLEWRMSMEFAMEALQGLPREQVMRLTYSDLVSDPDTVLEAVQRFIDVAPDRAVRAFARRRIRRRSEALADEPPSPREVAIAGPWLARTLAS